MPGFGDIAVGNGGGIVLLASDPTPRFTDLGSGFDLELTGVFGSAPTDMWAVGAAGTVLHYDGRTVEAVPSGTTANLTDTWGTGPSDVWAVGEGGTVVALRRQRVCADCVGHDRAPASGVHRATRRRLDWRRRPDAAALGREQHDTGAAGRRGTGGAVFDLHGIAADDIWLSGGDAIGTTYQAVAEVGSPTLMARRGHRSSS